MKRLYATITLSSFIMLNCSNVWASPPNLTPPETQALIDMLGACDHTVEAQKRYIDDSQGLIGKQTELIKVQGARVESLESNAKMDTRLLWFVAGMLTAGLTVYLVKPASP